MLTKSNKVFVSAYSNSCSLEQNKANHDKACDLLARDNVDFDIVKGCYKGKEELTILLSSEDITQHDKNLLTASNLAYLFGQEAILEICNDDAAILHHTKGHAQKVGKFVNVAKERALEQDCFTYCPVSEKYFIVREWS